MGHCPCFELNGPIANYIKAHNLSGAPSLSRFLTFLISPATQTQDPIFLPPSGLLQHRQRRSRRHPRGLHPCWMQSKPWSRLQCFNTAWERRLAAQKNGVSNGAWTALRWWLRCALNGAWTTPSNSAWTALVVAPKNGTSTRLNGAWKLVLQWRWLQSKKWHFNAPENWRWYGAAMALVAAPKMAAEQRQVWGLKRI